MKKNIFLLFVILFSFVCGEAFAADAFIVKNIQFQGLQRISAETVENYLPIKVGQSLKPEKTAAIINALYKTGFFEHISLAREGNTLIINLVERPTIGKLSVSGNSYIPTDKLTAVMKEVNVAEGRVYNKVVLEKIKQSLLNQYYLLGRYNARVDVTVKPMERNRVLIKIEISEGLIAKVRRINIIGNHAFSDSTLDHQLTLTTPGLFTFFTRTDRYSQEKLDSSLDQLRNFYMNRGYIKFNVKSSQVALTPDRKSIFLTIVIDEGQRYTISGFDIVGRTVLPKASLMKLVHIKAGDEFSRQATLDAEKAISDALGKEGYVFAVVSIEPKIDDSSHKVFLTFTVSPGKRGYVRHIYFTNNIKTNDEVLRREMLQMESAQVSTTKLEQSKRRISMLPFIKNSEMTIVPVRGTNDLVDVNYKVTEDSAAQATFSIGYSQMYHTQLGVGFNQKNFLGTGKTLGVNLTRSKYQQFYGMNYTNPYYTADGISRSINFSYSKIDPKYANLSNEYTSNQFNLSMIYGVPIGQEKDVDNRVEFGYGIEDILLHLVNPYSQQVSSFTNKYGRHYQSFTLLAGISRDSRDKAIFPTRGALQSLSANIFLPINGTSLKYYSLNYGGKWYHPIIGKFLAVARGGIGYGNAIGGSQNYPFFKNYYAGGIDTVPGYVSNSLGPQDTIVQKNGQIGHNSLGGNFLVDGTLGLVFPNGMSDNVRTTLFVAGGNVYNTYDNKKWGGLPSGPLRFSTGLAVDWLSPFGPVEVSAARALNARPGDSLNWFQFTLGANFG